MLIDPYLIANATGKFTSFVTLSNNLWDKTIRGEPSFHQIFLYAFADFLGLVLRIMTLTKNHLNK